MQTRIRVCVNGLISFSPLWLGDRFLVQGTAELSVKGWSFLAPCRPGLWLIGMVGMVSFTDDPKLLGEWDHLIQPVAQRSISSRASISSKLQELQELQEHQENQEHQIASRQRCCPSFVGPEHTSNLETAVAQDVDQGLHSDRNLRNTPSLCTWPLLQRFGWLFPSPGDSIAQIIYYQTSPLIPPADSFFIPVAFKPTPLHTLNPPLWRSRQIETRS